MCITNVRDYVRICLHRIILTSVNSVSFLSLVFLGRNSSLSAMFSRQSNLGIKQKNTCTCFFNAQKKEGKCRLNQSEVYFFLASHMFPSTFYCTTATFYHPLFHAILLLHKYLPLHRICSDNVQWLAKVFANYL